MFTPVLSHSYAHPLLSSNATYWGHLWTEAGYVTCLLHVNEKHKLLLGLIAFKYLDAWG